MTGRIGINCSKCGRWVGKDGFHDYDPESREMGYPLCKRCLDARPPTLYDLGMHQLQKYTLLYVDPPWEYRNKRTGRNNTSGAAHHYDTIPLEELCRYPIRHITEKDAAIFLWCTTPLLPDGFELLKAWGFEYKTTFYWRKVMSQGLGNWFRGQVEVMLIGVKGNLKPFHCQKPNFLQTKVRKHSQKPREIYGILESLNLTPRIELFARERRQGWDAWGNDLPTTEQAVMWK